MEIPRILPFTNPATGESFGHVVMNTPEEVQQAVQELRRVQKIWEATSLAERSRLLRKLQAVMVDEVDEITAVLNQDCGKSRQDALAEVFMTLDSLQADLKHAPGWLRRQKVSTGLYLFKRAYVEARPYGVVAVIAPWNYPLALSMPPVLAALLAGNTVILKPSEVTAATGVLIESLFRRVPELAPFVRVVHGDAAVGAAVVQALPDYIFITGSTQTGQKVMAAAAEHLIPVACELGGKDAMIVLADAQVAESARWGVWGACFNTGQTCMSVERAYVVESVYDEFINHALAAARELRVGYSPELNNPNYMGPITDPRQIQTIDRHLADAVEKGARILTGGNREGMFYDITILANVDHSMLVMQEETFGPILPIVKVRDEYEAIRLANDSKFGLGASIWSQDIAHARRVAHQVEAASVVINDLVVQFAIPLLPFGGIKHSGFGRTHGQEGLMQFTRPYAYVTGAPPLPYDFATIARKPGNYHLESAVLHLVLGVTPQQRLKPLKGALEQAPALKRGSLAIGAGVAGAAFAALAGYALKKRSSG